MKWFKLQQLKSRRPQMRKQAVAKLVAEEGAKAVDHLLPFVADPDSGVRKEVVRALGQTKDERALTALIHALRDVDGDVREAAVVALAQLDNQRAIEPLTRALGDPRHEVRWRAVRALDALGWQPANDEQEVLRAIAAGEFSKAASVGPAAVERLAAALRDERNPKRRMVVEALGQVGERYCVASESCAFDIIGGKLLREIEPGELVSIGARGIESREVVKGARRAFCVFEHIYFARPDSLVDGQLVYATRERMGEELAREHPAAGADCVFSVPDSSNAMALGFAETSGLKLEHALIRNHYVGRTFINPTQASRNAKVKIKFNPVREVLAGKKVVVVDDSLVRGTTSRELVQMIRQAGAREVHFRVASAPITGPCYYGIDTPQRRELIASGNSVEEIRRFIEADSLGYLSEEGMLNAVANGGDPQRLYCTACFTGKYPVVREEAVEAAAAVASS